MGVFYTKHCLSGFVFVKNQAVTIFYFTVHINVNLYFPYFLAHLGEIRYRRSPSNATVQWRVSWKLEWRRTLLWKVPDFLSGTWLSVGSLYAYCPTYVKFSTKYLKVILLNTSEFACKHEDSGSGTTSVGIITISVSPLITKLHFVIIYAVTDPLQPDGNYQCSSWSHPPSSYLVVM